MRDRKWKLVLTLLVGALLAAPAASQSPPAKSVESAKSADSSSAAKPVVLDEEARELLADRQLLFNEIERIVTAQGDAVRIPVSVRELERRAAAKWKKFQEWLRAHGVPDDWQAKGWRFDAANFTFHPPALKESPQSNAEGTEKKPETKKP